MTSAEVEGVVRDFGAAAERAQRPAVRLANLAKLPQTVKSEWTEQQMVEALLQHAQLLAAHCRMQLTQPRTGAAARRGAVNQNEPVHRFASGFQLSRHLERDHTGAAVAEQRVRTA